MGGRAENPALPQKGEEVQKCLIKKKSNTTRSHVNPTKSSGRSLAPAQTLTLAVSASVRLFREPSLPDGLVPFLVLEGQGV